MFPCHNTTQTLAPLGKARHAPLEAGSLTLAATTMQFLQDLLVICPSNRHDVKQGRCTVVSHKINSLAPCKETPTLPQEYTLGFTAM